MHVNEKALGRSWATANRATGTDFGDCYRVNLHWEDGGEVYYLEDTKAEAQLHLARLGFHPAP